jgi:hypothetical protein
VGLVPGWLQPFSGESECSGESEWNDWVLQKHRVTFRFWLNIDRLCPHHSAFQYYASTANPKHTRPTSVASIGSAGDAANHNYDINDFFSAVSSGNFPAVSFLKAAAIGDAHPGNSDPLDEQKFVVDTINFLSPGAPGPESL